MRRADLEALQLLRQVNQENARTRLATLSMQVQQNQAENQLTVEKARTEVAKIQAQFQGKTAELRATTEQKRVEMQQQAMENENKLRTAELERQRRRDTLDMMKTILDANESTARIKLMNLQIDRAMKDLESYDPRLEKLEKISSNLKANAELQSAVGEMALNATQTYMQSQNAVLAYIGNGLSPDDNNYRIANRGVGSIASMAGYRNAGDAAGFMDAIYSSAVGKLGGAEEAARADPHLIEWAVKDSIKDILVDQYARGKGAKDETFSKIADPQKRREYVLQHIGIKDGRFVWSDTPLSQLGTTPDAVLDELIGMELPAIVSATSNKAGAVMATTVTSNISAASREVTRSLIGMAEELGIEVPDIPGKGDEGGSRDTGTNSVDDQEQAAGQTESGEAFGAWDKTEQQQSGGDRVRTRLPERGDRSERRAISVTGDIPLIRWRLRFRD